MNKTLQRLMPKKFYISLDKLNFHGYNISVKGGLFMDGENEMIHNSDIGTGKLFDLYSQIIHSDGGSLKPYKEIAENPNVSDELRCEALKICEECERNKQETKKLVVNATVVISAMLIFAAVIAGKRY